MAYEQKKPIPLTDESIIPTGKYSKKPDGPLKMIDVPATYLMYIWDNEMCNTQVKQYIKDNYDVILKQAKEDGYASKD